MISVGVDAEEWVTVELSVKEPAEVKLSDCVDGEIEAMPDWAPVLLISSD